MSVRGGLWGSWGEVLGPLRSQFLGPGVPKIIKNEGLGGLWGSLGGVLGPLGAQGAKK